jgi:hypothetical protein
MHLSEELGRDGAEKIVVETMFGKVGGRRAMNGSAVFLGSFSFPHNEIAIDVDGVSTFRSTLRTPSKEVYRS